jgi:hypothetical protein
MRASEIFELVAARLDAVGCRTSESCFVGQDRKGHVILASIPARVVSCWMIIAPVDSMTLVEIGVARYSCACEDGERQSPLS